MSTEIKPLNLKVYNGTSDRKETFKRFTMDIAGDSDSNMTKISSWAEDVNSKIKDIDAIKDESSKLKVKDITTSVKDNTFNVIFSDDSTKEVFVKTVGGSSGELRVFKSSSSVPKSFTATEDVTQFIIEGLKETDEITLIFHGATMIKTDNYNTTYSNGICTVLLDFTLSKGETIWYLITETSYDYKDLSNAPRVVDNLETVTKGDALDASQGKELAKQIVNVDDKVGVLPTLKTTNKEDLVKAINENVDRVKGLSEDRGYLNTKRVSTGNVNDLIKNGKYSFYSAEVAGMPVEGEWVLDVTQRNDTWVYQKARCMYDTKGKGYTGVTIERDILDGTCQPWKNLEDEITDLQKRNYIPSIEGDRNTPTLPTDYLFSLKTLGLKNRTVMGLTGGGYVHALGFDAWTDETANVYELMFSQDGMYYRKSNSPTEWESPKKLATTDKIDISCTPETGYAIEMQNNYLINNIVYYNLDVKMADGSDIPINQQISVATMPQGMTPKYWIYGYGSTRSSGVTGESATIAFYNDGKIYATCKTSGKILGISGVVVL